MPIDSWDAERVATLTKMWASGFSATRIAGAMGFSRGAIIGKISRLGLPPPQKKLPVIIDRSYTRHVSPAEIAERKRKKRLYDAKRWEERKLLIETKREVRQRFLADGASPYSAAYRKHLPPMPEMSKAQMRAMLAQALQNTAAL